MNSTTTKTTHTHTCTHNMLTQNLTRKNADWGPLSYSSFNPPRLSGNLSAICRISTACRHKVRKYGGILCNKQFNANCTAQVNQSRLLMNAAVTSEMDISKPYRHAKHNSVHNIINIAETADWKIFKNLHANTKLTKQKHNQTLWACFCLTMCSCLITIHSNIGK